MIRGETESAGSSARAFRRALGSRCGAIALVVLGAATASCGSSERIVPVAVTKDPDAGVGTSGSGTGGSGIGGSGIGGTGGLGISGTGGVGGLTRCQTNAECLGTEICASNVCVVLPGSGGIGGNGGAGGANSGGRYPVGGQPASGGSAGADSGVSTGGTSTGGAPVGSGGAATGGAATGGATTGGGVSTGGAATGGAATGGAATGGGPPGSGGAATGGAGGSCAADSQSCSVQADCCGYPDQSVCINVGSPFLTCTPFCTFDDDCSTGCCVPQAGGFSACGPSSMCPQCVAPLDPCFTNGDCCGYPIDNRCVDFGQGTGVCAYTCNFGSECSSGCCAPLTSGTGSVCAPSSFCCSGYAERCSSDFDCCGTADANFCVDFGFGGQCTSSCFSDFDCGFDCCIPLINGGSACGPC